MARIDDLRHLAAGPAARRLERLVEQVIAGAAVDPATVVADARQRGLPVAGADVDEQVASLRRLHPAALDPLAASYVRSASLVAGAQGFVANLGGVATMALSLPADTVGALYWIARATSGVMTAYGFETASPEGAAQLRVGMLAAMGISSVAVEGTRLFVRQLACRPLTGVYREQVLAAGGREISRRVGLCVARGRVARAAPLVGGAVGGALNAGLVQAMGRRARRHYRALLAEWQANDGVGAVSGPAGALQP